MIEASVVLPSPGGPKSRTWSSASPRFFAASRAIASCSLAFCWPINSCNRRGRSFSSKEFSSSARAALTRRSGSSLAAIHSECSSLAKMRLTWGCGIVSRSVSFSSGVVITMRRFFVLLSFCFIFVPLGLRLNAFAQAVPQTMPMTDEQKAEMAHRVRLEFLHAWDGYRQYAWGHDDLKPLSNKPHDWYAHSLLMTPVDGLDTMIRMGGTPQVDEARKLSDTQLNFDQDMYVKDFEITIRMMGGLLSSYQLTGDKRLLELADDLGRRMLPIFNSPTGMPYEYVNLHTGAVRGNISNPAEVGTLLLEYGMWAKRTGKQDYYDKAKRAMVALHEHRSSIGLLGSTINVE